MVTSRFERAVKNEAQVVKGLELARLNGFDERDPNVKALMRQIESWRRIAQKELDEYNAHEAEKAHNPNWGTF